MIYARGLSPNAIFVVVTNPLDVMTYLACKRVLELTLSNEEREYLHTSAQSVRQNIERSQEILDNNKRANNS
ncbi:MAG: hypothetical protein V7K57_20985 [Nostoc sp.]|uniref:hypothetical protein n=1 Tax=Nostoc sp. TaxID=1180 RepID=UPI002FFB5748